MARNKPGDENPELEQLEVEGKRAEVDVKKARAKVAQAEADKKAREAGMGETVNGDPKLEGGLVRKHFYTIWRKPQGSGKYVIWKNGLAEDEIDSVEEFIRLEGDPSFDHKAALCGKNGKMISDPVYFASESAGSSTGPSSTELDRKLKEAERRLADARKAKQLEKFEKKTKRLLGEDDDEDEEGQDDHVFVPHLGGWFPRDHPMAMGMYPGMTPPWMQQPPQQTSILKDIMPLLVAWITKPAEKSPLADVLPLLISGANKGHLEPKDMLGMFSPIVAEMSRMSAQSSDRLMEGMSKMDDAFRKKMLDLLMSDPSRSPDEIEKWQKWLNFGESALRKGAGVVRDALKGSATDGKNPKKIEQRKPPALPGPKTGGDVKQQEGGGDKAATQEGQPAAEEQAQDPKAGAALLRKRRVEAFLLAAEEEMLAESDPVLMAEKSEELYLCLPKSLRASVEDVMKDDPPKEEKFITLFGSLKEICPEVTERIASVLMEADDKQEWMKDFLYACAFPETDEGGGEEEEEEETQEGPEGGEPAEMEA